MSFIEDVERLGKAADTGTMTHDEAAQELLRQHGRGHTLAAALVLINTWKAVRVEHDRLKAQHVKWLTALFEDKES